MPVVAASEREVDSVSRAAEGPAHEFQPCPRHPASGRELTQRAFTLIELLLTLAILAGATAMILPSFNLLLADRTLARAGDQLRVEMMQARLLAMRSGRTQMLQLQAGTAQCRLQAWFDMSDLTEATDQTGSGSALLNGGNASAASMQQTVAPEQPKMIQLPETILVKDSRVQTTQRSFLIDSQYANQGAAGDWGQPILFYPDGTTSTAAVTLQDSEAGQIVVLLRGLTGEVTVSDVLASETSE